MVRSILILAAAGSANASELALRGGMSIIDGTFITAVFMGLASIITAIGFLLWGKNYMAKREDQLRTQIANELQARVVNDPLHVQSVPSCISVKECNRRMGEMDARICKLEQNLNQGLSTIVAKLDAMDTRSEDRAIALNRRIDPIVEKTSKMSGELELIKAKMFKK